MSDIQVTSHRQLGNEHKGTTTHDVNGDFWRQDIAGYVVGECTVLCHECVGDNPDNWDVITADSESDFPGFVCEDCQEYLDTYLLVYQSQDPELHWRIRMSEEMGEYDSILTIEDIAEQAKEKAYNIGYSEVGSMQGEWAEGGEFSDENHPPEPPTDSARYANIIAPKLRAIAGYEDSGHGTYTQEPIDMVTHIFNEDIHPAFRAGYYDGCMGEKRDPITEL